MSRAAQLQSYLDEVRAKIASCDGGDRPPSPPAALLREERETEAALAALRSAPPQAHGVELDPLPPWANEPKPVVDRTAPLITGTATRDGEEWRVSYRTADGVPGHSRISDAMFRERWRIVDSEQRLAAIEEGTDDPPLPVDRDDQTRYHEAGHAVMALALGDRLDLVSVVPGSGTRGHVDALPDTAFTSIMIAAAGKLAAEMKFGFSGVMVDGDASRSAPLLGGVEYEEYRSHARWILSIHWHAVEALADALHGRRRLTGAEAKAVVGRLEPRATTPSDLRGLAARESAAVIVQQGHLGEGTDVSALLVEETLRPTMDDVRTRVCAYLRERAAFGLAKYKRPLRPHDGRDSLVDALQEALDGWVYARKAELEGRCAGEIVERSRTLAFAITAQIMADERQGIGGAS